MPDPEPCELHDTLLFGRPEGAQDLVRLARSPIGDECRSCSVCRLAREYVTARLDEEAGRPVPTDQHSEAAWERLRSAVERVRATSLHGA
jgi:hypothetical protein